MLSESSIHPSLPASDLARAKAWYAAKLGFSPSKEVDGTLVYSSGSSMFTIYETSSAGTARNTAAIWVVEDLDREMAELRGRGVVFEDFDIGDFKTVNGVAADPETDSKAAWFLDSEGNTLALSQWPASMRI